jgi:hypothetical protein
MKMEQTEYSESLAYKNSDAGELPRRKHKTGFDVFVRCYFIYLPFIPHARKLYSVYTGRPPWPTFKYYAGFCLEGLMKSKKNSSRSSHRHGPQERYNLSQFSQWFSSLLSLMCTLNCSRVYLMDWRASFFPVCNRKSPPQTAKNRG